MTRRGWGRGWNRRWGRGAHRHHRRKPCWWAALPLTELPVGQMAEVTDILSRRESRLAHLSTYGLVPGSFVRLEQRYPAYVVRVGETEVTLDTEIAREIIVRIA